MSSIIYKRLFEVKFLHEYYLSESVANNYFGLPQDQRESILKDKIANDGYDIWKDLMISPTEWTKQKFRGHHFRFIATKTGFFVAIKVRSVLNDTGVEEFFPMIKVPSGMKMDFNITIKNPYFKNYSNLNLSPSLPAIYYFDNKNPNADKVYPTLSTPVESYQPGKFYEMGELATISTNLRLAVTRTNSSASTNWQDVQGDGFVHEGERIAVPYRFSYKFPAAVSSVEVHLLDASGSTVKTLNLSSSQPKTGYSLDLRFDDNGKKVAEGLYTLEVIGDGSVVGQRSIFLSGESYPVNGLGIVRIFTESSDQDYQLFQSSGALVTQRTDGQITKLHPVFEIRLKSRQTIWRYRSTTGKNLSTTLLSDPYLEEDAGVLNSRLARPLLATPTFFENNDPSIDSIFLPNPPDHSFSSDGARLYSNIYVSKIKNLINE